VLEHLSRMSSSGSISVSIVACWCENCRCECVSIASGMRLFAHYPVSVDARCARAQRVKNEWERGSAKSLTWEVV